MKFILILLTFWNHSSFQGSRSKSSPARRNRRVLQKYKTFQEGNGDVIGRVRLKEMMLRSSSTKGPRHHWMSDLCGVTKHVHIRWVSCRMRALGSRGQPRRQLQQRAVAGHRHPAALGHASTLVFAQYETLDLRFRTIIFKRISHQLVTGAANASLFNETPCSSSFQTAS